MYLITVTAVLKIVTESPILAELLCVFPLPAEWPDCLAVWSFSWEHLLLLPWQSSVLDVRAHWWQFEIPLVAKIVISFLSSSLFKVRPAYVFKPFSLGHAVICKTSAIDDVHIYFLKGISSWALEGELVMFWWHSCSIDEAYVLHKVRFVHV